MNVDADELRDEVQGRQGWWMHTDSGMRFFPEDPLVSEICMNDIANGLAMTVRYNGQGRTDRFYSVAEHSAIMARWACDQLWPARVCLAILLHDAAEAYVGDLIRAVKNAVGEPYKRLENQILYTILAKYGCQEEFYAWRNQIKALDSAIVNVEKRQIMRNHQPWAHDVVAVPPTLAQVRLNCFLPERAKLDFATAYRELCLALNIEPEEIGP